MRSVCVSWLIYDCNSCQQLSPRLQTWATAGPARLCDYRLCSVPFGLVAGATATATALLRPCLLPVPGTRCLAQFKMRELHLPVKARSLVACS